MGLVYMLLGWLSTAVSFYLLLIFVYVLASWLPGSWNRSRPMYWLARCVVPYLGWFRRLRFLQVGLIDFSPLLGIALLYFVRSLLEMLRHGGLTFASVLGTLLTLLVGLLNAILNLLLVLFVLRIVFYFFNPKMDNPFFKVVDLTARGMYRNTLGRLVSQKTTLLAELLICTALLGLMRWGLGFWAGRLLGSG